MSRQINPQDRVYDKLNGYLGITFNRDDVVQLPENFVEKATRLLTASTNRSTSLSNTLDCDHILHIDDQYTLFLKNQTLVGDDQVNDLGKMQQLEFALYCAWLHEQVQKVKQNLREAVQPTPENNNGLSSVSSTVSEIRPAAATIPTATPTITTPAVNFSFDATDTSEDDKRKIFSESFNDQAKSKLLTFLGRNNTRRITLEIAKDTSGKDDIQFLQNNICVIKFIFTELAHASPNPVPNITPQNKSTEVTLSRRYNSSFNTATWQCTADDANLFSVADGFRLIAEQSLALRKKEKISNPTAIKISLSDLGSDSPTQRTICGNTVNLTAYEFAAIDAHIKAGYTHVEYKAYCFAQPATQTTSSVIHQPISTIFAAPPGISPRSLTSTQGATPEQTPQSMLATPQPSPTQS